MTKKNLLKQLEKFPDETIIMIEGEHSPIPITEIDKGVGLINGIPTQLCILTAEEPEQDEY